MKKQGLVSPLLKVITLCAAGLFLAGCAAPLRLPEAHLDSPEHHISNGFTLIHHQRFQAAKMEFETALRLNPESSDAHRGLALVYGMRGDFEWAFESMTLAGNYGKGEEDKAQARVGFIRLHTMERGKDWLVKAERYFSQAQSLAGDMPEAYYYMGLAYKEGYRLEEAAKAFHKVLDINETLVLEAGEQLRIIEKIRQAGPETELGKRIAVLEWVTKADVAGLLIRELRLDEICRNFYWVIQNMTLPPDARAHFYKEEILRVLRLDIMGLRLEPDGTFGPDDAVTRADYAVMMADIIMKLRKDTSLVSKYEGRGLPFKDVPQYAPYFSAVMLCHAWGPVIESNHELFNPLDRVSGADAVLSVRRLKDKFGGLRQNKE